MARNYTPVPKPRSVGVVETAFPAAPETKDNVVTSPLPTGVYETAGAKLLQIDVTSAVGTSGNAVIAVYAWNRQLQLWSFVSSNNVAVVPAGSVGTVGQQATRLTVTNWGADFAAVLVTTLPTAGDPTHPTQLTVAPTIEDR